MKKFAQGATHLHSALALAGPRSVMPADICAAPLALNIPIRNAWRPVLRCLEFRYHHRFTTVSDLKADDLASLRALRVMERKRS